jgi:hypothetical protein
MKMRTKTTHQAPPTEGEIVLHVEIGRVPWKMGGEGNAVGEAFRIAGEYVGEHAFTPGSDPSVSFEFMGTTFTASASTPEAPAVTEDDHSW